VLTRAFFPGTLVQRSLPLTGFLNQSLRVRVFLDLFPYPLEIEVVISCQSLGVVTFGSPGLSSLFFPSRRPLGNGFVRVVATFSQPGPASPVFFHGDFLYFQGTPLASEYEFFLAQCHIWFFNEAA